MPDTGSALAAALAKAQAVMHSAKFNKINPHFKNRYADLASIIDAIRKPLADNGLAVTQTTDVATDGTGFGLHTTLRHSSGETVDSFYPLPQNAKPQELGSALTYARRYSLSAIVCIAADDDDDAEGAKNVETREKIMADQVDALEAMTEEVGADRTAVLKYFKVANFGELLTSDYNRVVTALEKKRAK